VKDLLRDGGINQVVEFVRGLIGKRAPRPGSRLPAERDLAVQIGVSRPAVRGEMAPMLGSTAELHAIRGARDRPQAATPRGTFRFSSQIHVALRPSTNPS